MPTQTVQVKIEKVLEDLHSDIRGALDDTLKQLLPDAQYNIHELFRFFVDRVDYRCKQWETLKPNAFRVT